MTSLAGLRGVLVVALALCTMMTSAAEEPTVDVCNTSARAREAVIESLQAFYSALRESDERSLEGTITPDFYAFDVGQKLSAAGLIELLRNSESQGRRFEWSLSQFEVRVSCTLASITYLNSGGVRSLSGFTPLTWLESATLERTPDGWRVAFLHSTRVKDIDAASRTE